MEEFKRLFEEYKAAAEATNKIEKAWEKDPLVLMGHNQYDTTLIYAKVKTSRVEQSYRMYCE